MDVEKNKVHEFVAHSTQVNCLTFGPLSNQVLATGGEDCKVNIWRVGNASNIWTLGQNKSPIECLCFDKDEQYVVSGALNGSLKIFDLNEGKLARSLLGHQVNTCAIDYHPFGEFIVSGSIDTTMKVWDIRNKICIQTYTGHDKEITCVKFSPDGRWVASTGKDGQLFIWDLIAGKLLHSVRVQPSLSYVTTFEFNPSEFLLAAVTSTKSIKLWDLDTMEQIGYTPPDQNQIKCMSFSSQGSTLCSATSDAVKVWSWDPVILKASSNISWDKIQEIRVTSDNQLVAGACSSNFVSIWALDLENVIAAGIQNSKDDERRERERERMNKDKAAAGGGAGGGGVPVRNKQGRGSIDLSADSKYDVEDFDSKPSLMIHGMGAGSSSSNTPAGAAAAAAKATPASIPEVQWSEGSSAKEMATSMGESFFARLKEAEDKGRHLPPAMNVAQMAALLPPQSAARFQSQLSGAGVASALGVADKGFPVRDRRLRKAVLPHSNISRNNESVNIGVAPERIRAAPSPSPAPLDPFEVVGQRHNRRVDDDSPKSVTPSVSSPEPVIPRRKRVEDDMKLNNNAPPAIGFPVSVQPQGVSENNLNIHHPAPAPTPVSVPIPIPRSRRVEEEYKQNISNTNITNNDDDEYISSRLDKLSTGSPAVTAIIQQRLSAIKMLKRLWEKGDINDVMAQLQMLYENSLLDPRQLAVIVHFLEVVELGRNSVTLDIFLQLLPILHTLVSLEPAQQHDHYVAAALHSTYSLYSVFGSLIIQTRSIGANAAGGVDLSREDRLHKCNKCYVFLVKIKDCLETLRRRHKNNSYVIDLIANLDSVLEDLV